jgi:hypothetical protein
MREHEQQMMRHPHHAPHEQARRPVYADAVEAMAPAPAPYAQPVAEQAPVDAVPYFPPMKTAADEAPVVTGYLDRVITVSFPELTKDPAADPVWVQLRNPMLVPPELLVTDVPTGPDGMPISAAAGLASMYEVIGKLALDWRVYDATTDPRKPPVLLGEPSAENAAKLPIAIINKIGKMIEAAATPQ